MSQPLRSGALLASGLLAALALTGCSAGAPDHKAAPAATHPAAPSLPTGRTLATRLLPASALPATLTLAAGSSRDTGDHNVAATPAPFPAAKVCDQLSGTSWIRVAGHDSAAWAQNDYTDKPGDMVAQETDSYPGTGARQTLAALHAAVARCATFTTRQGGTSYTEHLALKPLPGVGDEAFEAVITAPAFKGGTTLVAVRSGHVVVTVLDNSLHNTGSAAAGYARALTARLPAAH